MVLAAMTTRRPPFVSATIHVPSTVTQRPGSGGAAAPRTGSPTGCASTAQHWTTKRATRNQPSGSVAS
jgi:hypothetical protein